MMEPTGTAQELADVCGLLARATSGWAGTRSADWVLRLAGMPSLSDTVKRLRAMVGEYSSAPAATEDDGA